MSSLGIYFGPRIIAIVETKGKKFLRSAQFSPPIISSGELEEKVPMEVKSIEIIARFKDELRKNKIEAKEATLCLSGKDLIIRTFEIPIMPPAELQAAINFEVRKYIPFKVEELISDFQALFDKTSRKNLVLFIGIKKESLDRYLSILSQLDMNVNAIEYSAFSVLRCLRLNGASDRGVIGVLGADLKGEDEINFTVLENGFPLFSRDIAIGEGGELEKARETGHNELLEKLKTEIRVSLDYYHRKFPSKNIKKILFFSHQDYRADLEAFMMEGGTAVHFIDSVKFIDKSVPYSLSLIKGYSSSLSKTLKINLKLDLLAVREKVALLLKEKSAPLEAASLLKGLKIEGKTIALSLLICILIFGFGFYRGQDVRKEIEGIIAGRTQTAAASGAERTYEELTRLDSDYKKKLETLETVTTKQLYLTFALEVIPKAIPKDVWLTNFSFSKKKEDDRAELVLEGMAYLADNDKEYEAINKFLGNLKENPHFVKYFREINITSLDHASFGKAVVTNFSISCKTYEGKR